MYLKKFSENLLIKKIKISGPFISIYVPAEKLERFQERYQKLLKRYNTLAIGEGIMHDFAHNKRNKHLSSLFTRSQNKEKNEHFHFILPAIVNEYNLETFLNFIDDEDLSKEQKHQLVQEYKDHTNTMSLEKLSEQVKTYTYLVSALLSNDHYFGQMMPLFTQLVQNLEPFMKNSEDDVDIPPSKRIQVGEHEVCARDAYENLMKFMEHIGFLNSFKEKIDKLQKSKIESGTMKASDEIIKELNDLFESASKTPLPSFSSLPHLYNELTAYFPFVDEGIDKIYEIFKQEFSDLLNTEDLQFTPQRINLSTKDLPYNEAISFLIKQGNAAQKIMGVMTKLKEGKSHYFNPYWMNSGEKLNGVIDAVLKLKNNGDNLDKMLQDPQSELYLALNKKRLSPITFLGRFSINKSKSVLQVEEEIANSNGSKRAYN